MANTNVSTRGTAWDIIVTHPGFRLGFSDVRLGIEWPKDDLIGRSVDYRWWYEDGRLFAASHYSRRWRTMPSVRRDVKVSLLKAIRAAQLGGVWPRHEKVKA